MNLDHIHEWKRSLESGVRFPIAILVVEHPADVRVIHLQQFLAAIIPQRQPFDLCFEIGARHRPATVLSAWRVLHWKGVLMIQRQRNSCQLHPGDGREERFNSQTS